jgi:uncharacterized membrane protein
MPATRRAWIGFALFAPLAILGLFVLDGAIAGVTLFAAMLVFIGACIYALRGEDRDAVTRSDRTGLAGWIGGWF